MVFIFANRQNNEGKLGYLAQAYVYPYFEQNWSLFVPPPDSNYKLYVCSSNNKAVTKDIFTEILNQHQANRLKGYEPFLIGLVNSIHYFEKNALLNKLPEGQVKNDLYFNIVKHFSENYFKHFYKQDLNDKKLILVVNALNKPSRVYYN